MKVMSAGFFSLIFFVTLSVASEGSDIDHLIDASKVNASQKRDMHDVVAQVSQADGFKDAPDLNRTFFTAVLNAMEAENQKKNVSIFNKNSVGSAYLVWATEGLKSEKVVNSLKILKEYTNTIESTNYKGSPAMRFSAVKVFKADGWDDQQIEQYGSTYIEEGLLFISRDNPILKGISTK